MSEQDRMSFKPTTPGGDEIPGLVAARKTGGKSNAKAIVGVVAVLVSMAVVAAYVVHRKLEARKAQQQAPKSEDVASANAPRLTLREGRGEASRADQAGAASMRTTEPVFEGDQKTPPGKTTTRVPGLTDDGDGKAIPVVRTGARQSSTRQGTMPPNPVDAPVFASQGRNGNARTAARTNRTAGDVDAEDGGGEAHDASFRQRMAGLLKRKEEVEAQMARAQASNGSGNQGMGPPAGMAAKALSEPSDDEPPAASRLLGGLEKSATPRVFAQRPINRSLTVPKGTIFQCALKTRVVTATSGFVSCLVQRDVYSHDGKIVLVDRGSHLDGEYRMLSVRPGLTRIPVMWTRLLMPDGVPVDLESPAVGQLGESGIGGHVDNRWVERIGAALLISMADDTLKIAARQQGDGGSTVYLPSTTEQGSKIAEEVLKTTVNIPPLLYQNQGSVVGVYVARDLDFSRVYRLVPQ